MNYTEDLKLKKPEPDDYYNIDDFNENADTVDAAIFKTTKDIANINANIKTINETHLQQINQQIREINHQTIPKIDKDISDIKNTTIPSINDGITKINDITIPKIYTDINDALTPKVHNVTVQVSNWTANGDLWRFKTTVKATDGDGIEIQDIPPVAVLKLTEDGIQLMAENDTGVISIIALGAKPAIAVKMSVKVQKERVQ